MHHLKEISYEKPNVIAKQKSLLAKDAKDTKTRNTVNTTQNKKSKSESTTNYRRRLDDDNEK